MILSSWFISTSVNQSRDAEPKLRALSMGRGRALVGTFFAAFLFFLNAPWVSAEELRVLDSHGLARAVSRGEGEIFRVVVETAGLPDHEEQRLELQELGGAQRRIRESVEAEGAVIFDDVGAGSWQLTPLPKGRIQTVRIEVVR